MKIVNLSQLPSLYQAQRVKEEVVITLYDNVKDVSTEENVQFEADMYQLRLPYRKGLLSSDSYDAMLAFAKRLSNPSNAVEERQARDVLV